MKPKQFCYWSEASSSPHKAVGSHILAGFIFTSAFSRDAVGVKDRTPKEQILSWAWAPLACVVRGIFHEVP